MEIDPSRTPPLDADNRRGPHPQPEFRHQKPTSFGLILKRNTQLRPEDHLVTSQVEVLLDHFCDAQIAESLFRGVHGLHRGVLHDEEYGRSMFAHIKPEARAVAAN